jgi:predicted aspartyl protease
MEIVKKARISVNGSSEEVEAVIDTGADRTMMDEELLLRLGAPHMGNWKVQSMGEFKDTKPVYVASVEIGGVAFPLTVFGGKKNLIGHDFLQLAKAVINEETGEVRLTKSWIEM